MIIDFVTTAVPRDTIKETMESVLRSLDKCGYKIRWIVHLDDVPLLRENFEQTKEQIMLIGKEFDEVLYLESDGHIGHKASFFKVIEPVQNDMIFWEDDRVCSENFSIDQLYEKKSDYVSFFRKRLQVGNFGPSFWSRRLVNYVRLRKKMVERSNRNVEVLVKKICSGYPFSREKIKLLNGSGEIGRQWMADNGIDTDRYYKFRDV